MKCKYRYILALDPSGNFHEGKGTTGWVLMHCDKKLIDIGTISAKDYHKAEEYWDAHIKLINKYYRMYNQSLIVVMEDYILYKSKSKNQINSKIETCRLLGIIQHYCWKKHLDYSLQLASTVKDRWADEILLHENILRKNKRKWIHRQSGIQINSEHTRDAFRHAIHYTTLKNKELSKRKKNYKGVKKSNYDN